MPRRINEAGLRSLCAGPRSKRALAATLLALGLSQGALAAERAKKAPEERPDYTAAQSATALPEGLPASVRIAGDDVAAFQALIGAAARASDPWLVLSGGGENGAFAAGLLAGWSERGDRPAFGVITGVSTGALIAPFAFAAPSLGAGADAALRKNYTEISAADVFEFGATRDSLTDTWPLKERIEQGVTPALLAAVAAEHAKGRRLLIATTQVDSERPVLWDMGAIATRGTADGDPRALKLFRAIVLASTAVPGVFPPVAIPAEAKDAGAGAAPAETSAKPAAKPSAKSAAGEPPRAPGKEARQAAKEAARETAKETTGAAATKAGTIEELHDDGGAMGPFYLAPAAAVQGETRLHLPARTVYLVVNNRLDPEFQMATRTTLSVLGRTMSAAIKAQTRAALALTRAYAERTGLDLRVALIDGRFTKTSERPFDQPYMQALFAYGEGLARDGSAFVQVHAPAAARETYHGAADSAGSVAASR